MSERLDQIRQRAEQANLHDTLTQLLQNTTANFTPPQQEFVVELVERTAKASARTAADMLLVDAKREIAQLKAAHVGELATLSDRIAALEGQQQPIPAWLGRLMSAASSASGYLSEQDPALSKRLWTAVQDAIAACGVPPPPSRETQE